MNDLWSPREFRMDGFAILGVIIFSVGLSISLAYGGQWTIPDITCKAAVSGQYLLVMGTVVLFMYPLGNVLDKIGLISGGILHNMCNPEIST